MAITAGLILPAPSSSSYSCSCSHSYSSHFCPFTPGPCRRSLLASSTTFHRPPLLSSPGIRASPSGASATGPDDGFHIEVSKPAAEEGGAGNSRVIRARARVDATLESVWAVLTDYEGLSSFIPSLAESRLLSQSGNFTRLFQVGQQELALGLKFNAKGVIDCYEGELEALPLGSGGGDRRRREIQFKMVEGDFETFQGKWSIEESTGGAKISEEDEPHTTLFYMVELKPKLWMPVGLIEGRICGEIRTNIMCIREQAHRVQQLRSKEDGIQHS